MALPAAGYFNSPLRTVGEMKQALDDQRGFVAEHATRFGATASSAYAVSVSEGSSWLLCNGTFPVTLPSASAAGSNWCHGIINGGTGVITVKPQAGQTIDGAPSTTGIPLRPGEVMQVVCTGSGYYRISHHQSQGMIQQAAYWTTPGTYSWTKRAGITVICWFLQAPGGGGAAQLYPSSGGGGGGGGEYREGWSIAPIAETTYTITLGSPGSGGTTSGVAGGNGGTTSISGIASAIGGQGGTSGGGGGAGGSGGSGGQLVLPGQPGVAAAFGSGGPGGGNGRGGGAGQQSSNTAGSGTAGVDGGGGAGGNVGQAGQAGGGPSVGILC